MTAVVLRGDAARLPLPDESVDLTATLTAAARVDRGGPGVPWVATASSDGNGGRRGRTLASRAQDYGSEGWGFESLRAR